MSELLKYWPVALFVLNGLTLWFCWSLRQLAKTEVQTLVSQATAPITASVDKLADKVSGQHDQIQRHEGRLDGLDDDIAQLPTKADLARVEGEIGKVGDKVGQALGGIGRLEGYFLKEGVEALR
ncbi:hypothetical protein [Phenylobacterium sp. 58.2.17]|uniref:hypothetical protein n=1 Tax=Phenylobacterium sp. 58.2.17 TaxID=2969306 RepID=UPI002264714C|nr:hypothetical protein [Phenylobacterium sp. 58.2.17]MCX7586554.1 hypothetical protein [Phenylobacterium sp. 58.2.17]